MFPLFVKKFKVFSHAVCFSFCEIPTLDLWICRFLRYLVCCLVRSCSSLKHHVVTWFLGVLEIHCKCSIFRWIFLIFFFTFFAILSFIFLFLFYFCPFPHFYCSIGFTEFGFNFNSFQCKNAHYFSFNSEQQFESL